MKVISRVKKQMHKLFFEVKNTSIRKEAEKQHLIVIDTSSEQHQK